MDDEELLALTPKGEPKRSRSPFIQRAADRHRFVVRIERQGHPRYFDVARNRTLLSEINDPVYHPHVIAAKEEIRSWRSYYIEPSLVRRETGVYGADDPGRHGESLAPFFWRLKNEFGQHFKTVALNLRSLIPSLSGIEVYETMGRLEPMVIEAGGGSFPFRIASEGTLRLLCLLAIAVAPRPPALVAYEEPENGVQASRLDVLAQILGNLAQRGSTQVLVTSHSQTFLDLLKRYATPAFVACRRTEAGGSVFVHYHERDRLFASQDLEDRTPLTERVARGDL